MKRQNLTPKTSISGSGLKLDFPGLQVGIAEYPKGPTGCTVLAFDEPAELLIDVRGGAPYVVGDFGVTDAICLTGGSVYGIEAVAGVNRAILDGTIFIGTRWRRSLEQLSMISVAERTRFTRTQNLGTRPGRRSSQAASHWCPRMRTIRFGR